MQRALHTTRTSKSSLLGEDVGIESDAHGVGHNLHALYLLERHGLYNRVVKVGDVDGYLVIRPFN